MYTKPFFIWVETSIGSISGNDMFELLELVNLTRIDCQVLNSAEVALVAKADNSRQSNSNNTFLMAAEIPEATESKITPDNNNFNYSGRVNWKNSQAPAFSYPGTAVKFQFTGTSLKVELSETSWGSENYIDVYLDDNSKPITIQLQKKWGKPVIYDVASGLEDKIHTATIVKRNDYIAGEFKLNGIIIDGELLPANPDSERKIEVYGDSISAGAVVEYGQAGVQDPEGDNLHLYNAYHSYASILARSYDAELSLVAQSGASLIDDFGYWHQGTGMEAFYNKLAPLDDAPLWDFSKYNPDLVIIALGQNDSATIEIGKDMTAETWKDRYKQFMVNLRSQHPDAYFVGMFPNMYHDTQWDAYLTEAIAEYRQEYNDNRVFSLIHPQVTPGHPRISEQQQMADTLKEFIDDTLTKNGFNWDVAK